MGDASTTLNISNANFKASYANFKASGLKCVIFAVSILALFYMGDASTTLDISYRPLV